MASVDTTYDRDDPERPLNEREELWLAAYRMDPNKKAAAVAAGYDPKNAKQMGSHISKRPNVAAAINRHRAELANRMAIEVNLTEAWLVEQAKENLLAAKKAGNHGIVRACIRDLMQYLGMLDRDATTDAPADEFMSLEDRLHEYERRSAIGAAENVTELRPKANGAANGHDKKASGD